MSETELAWAAGFFDGEGTVGLYYRKDRDRYVLRLSITQKDRRPLARFHQAVGGVGLIYYVRPTARSWRDWYHYQIGSNREILQVMGLLWPYLSEPKQEQWTRAKALYDDYRANLNFGRGYRGPKHRELTISDGPLYDVAVDSPEESARLDLEEGQ